MLKGGLETLAPQDRQVRLELLGPLVPPAKLASRGRLDQLVQQDQLALLVQSELLALLV